MRDALKQLIDRARSEMPEPFTGRGTPGKRRISADGKLECAICKQWLPTTQYYVHHAKARKGGWDRLHHSSYCHECRKLASVARNHAISAEQYREIIAEAGNR